MFDYLWAAMIIVGIIVAAFLGNFQVISEGIISSTKEAIDLLIVMLGVIGMWNGLLQIAKESGLTARLAKKMRPILKLIFPSIPDDDESLIYISENFVANILGLGWACTPAGLRAVKSLQQLQARRGDSIYEAGDEMCTFLILNISSLQLIPMTVIAYRSQYGSVNPVSIVGPALIATSINTLLAFMVCKLVCSRSRRGR